MAEIRIGTSGWHYAHWVGPFYPPGTPAGAFLRVYAEGFDTVEVNRTFYRLPSVKAVTAWREATPPGFVFACKASQFITHAKKLKDPAASLVRFAEVADAFGDTLGPVLFQLPPRFRANAPRLEEFLAALPAHWRCAFEFRDESWFAPAIQDILARHNAAFCIYELAGRRSPVVATADFVYVRLHGPDGAYAGRYDARALGRWAGRLTSWRAEGRDAFLFFDNDQAGYAAGDAARLRARLAKG